MPVGIFNHLIQNAIDKFLEFRVKQKRKNNNILHEQNIKENGPIITIYVSPTKHTVLCLELRKYSTNIHL